jgi:ribosome-binding factor A
VATQRIRRLNEQIREVVAEAIGSLKDPRIGFVTITDVRTATDLRSAEVFFTVLPDDEASLAATTEGLSSAAPLLRRQLGTVLRTRNTPDLHFTPDPLPAHGRRIESLLQDAAGADRADGDEDADSGG